tara:strand:+ start:1055 stop:1600 length:546 start_codon:yes stop_codon:yes gene_type:complete
MKKHVDKIYAKSFDIVDYYDDITHNTWVHMGTNITMRLVYNKNGKYSLQEYGTKLNLGYLEKADGKVIYHTVADEHMEINRNNMQVHLAVVVVSQDEEEEVDEEKILKVGHYIWEYYTTRSREAGELRVKLENIKLRYDWRDRKYVVFIKYRGTWKSMYKPYITYHSETTPDHSEGYQLKL